MPAATETASINKKTPRLVDNAAAATAALGELGDATTNTCTADPSAFRELATGGSFHGNGRLRQAGSVGVARAEGQQEEADAVVVTALEHELTTLKRELALLKGYSERSRKSSNNNRAQRPIAQDPQIRRQRQSQVHQRLTEAQTHHALDQQQQQQQRQRMRQWQQAQQAQQQTSKLEAELASWKGKAELSAASYRTVLGQAQTSHRARMKQSAEVRSLRDENDRLREENLSLTEALRDARDYASASPQDKTPPVRHQREHEVKGNGDMSVAAATAAATATAAGLSSFWRGVQDEEETGESEKALPYHARSASFPSMMMAMGRGPHGELAGLVRNSPGVKGRWIQDWHSKVRRRNSEGQMGVLVEEGASDGRNDAYVR